MSLAESQKFKEMNGIFLGFECVFPDELIIPKVRFFVENLVKNPEDKDRACSDFFNIINEIGHFPITDLLKNLMDAGSVTSQVLAVLRLVDHCIYDPEIQNESLFSTARLGEENKERTLKVLSGYLDNLSQYFDLKVFLNIKKLLLEKNTPQNIRCLLDIYDEVYDNSVFRSFKKGFEHYFSLRSSAELLEFLGICTSKPLFEATRKVMYKFPEINLADPFSQGQMKSKEWAVETLKELSPLPIQSIFLMCGWYGLFVNLIDELWGEAKIKRIRSVDIDPNCLEVADQFNKARIIDNWSFKAVTADIHNLKINEQSAPVITLINDRGEFFTEEEPFDLWVNTSCEHIQNFDQWYSSIPNGQFLLLQSNDFFDITDHVNCVNSVAEFREQTPMTKRLYSGALPLGQYTRYMTIGYK